MVTSRWQAWGRQAISLRLGVLSRPESIGFLRQRTGVDDPDGLDAIADVLGDLPLALEEAAAYIQEARIGAADYLDLVQARSREMFGLDARQVVTDRATGGGWAPCGRCRWTGFGRRNRPRRRC